VLGVDPVRDADAAFEQITDDLSDGIRLGKIFADFRPSHVLHTGGISGPMVFPDQPARVMAINVAGSLNVIQAALQTDVSTLVYCSSIAAIGEYWEPLPIDDSYPMRPDSPYGCSKAAMDMVLRGLWGRTALDLCSLRFTAVYGPGRQTYHVIHDLVRAARSGEAVTVQDSTPAQLIYVDDAADAAVAAAFSANRRQLHYFIAHPEMVELAAAAHAVTEAIGPVTWSLDPALPRVRRGAMDLSAAARDFGFQAQVGYREGIRRLAAHRG
jgi:nucleoside-diphosphate-sugar epimerase